MEEEEIQSYASTEGEPHSPPGHITVTVAAPAPQSTAMTKFASLVKQSHQSHLTLALPIQHTARPIGSSSGGREDCWSEGATSVLIDAWGERYTELSRGNLKQKHWKEVADIVSSREDNTKTPKTDIQCKNRIDTVKKKYKIEKAKVTSGCGPSHWPFFERLDCLLSPPPAASAAKFTSPATASATATSVGFNSQKAVPMGIPVGVRPMPLPGLPHYSPHHHLQIPPHLQPQLQPPPPPQLQQQLRQNNFPSLPPMLNKFNNTVNNDANSISNNNKPQIKRGPPPPPPVDSESDQEEGWSQGSADSLPLLERKRPRVELNGLGGKVNERMGKENGKREKARKVWGNSIRELTKAILKFGEAYEAAESAKLQQIVEIEKQKMKFAKELELQRMKFFMKTQLELSQRNDNGSNNSGTKAGGSSGRAGGGGVGGSNHHNHHDNHLSQAFSDASE